MFELPFLKTKPGLSLVVVTYKRTDALKVLLTSVLAQKVKFDIELILINNDPDKQLLEDPELLKLVNKFKYHRQYDSQFNYDVSIRYYAAIFAKFERLMFLDDDVKIRDESYLQYMWDSFDKVRPIDWISSWGQQIELSKSGEASTIPTSFMQEDLTEVIEIDLIGPGISMFTKQLLHPEVIVIPFEDWGLDNIIMSIKASQVLGTKKYYIPSYKMLRFTDFKTEAIHARVGVKEKKAKLTQDFVDGGYKPVKYRK